MFIEKTLGRAVAAQRLLPILLLRCPARPEGLHAFLVTMGLFGSPSDVVLIVKRQEDDVTAKLNGKMLQVPPLRRAVVVNGKAPETGGAVQAMNHDAGSGTP